MSTDNYKQVLYNDGEGITFGDLNDQQRYLEAKVWEQIFHNHISAVSVTLGKDPQFSGQDGSDHPTGRCYCPNPGAAYLRQGSANNKLQVAPGVLLQKLAVLTGDDPQIVAYTFAGTEEWTIANGDATNPRVDLMQMQLSYVNGDLQSRDFEDATTRIVTTTSNNKKRRVQCVLTVKQGTPSATPVIPEPDAGTVVVGTALVGATYAGAALDFGVQGFSSAHCRIHDQRVPLGMRVYRTDPSQFKLVTSWSLTNNGSSVAAVSGTNLMYVPCNALNTGRLMAVGIVHLDPASTNPSGMHLGPSSGFTSTTFATAKSLTSTIANTGSAFEEIFPFYTFEANDVPGAGTPITQSTTSKIGVPLWTNGLYAPIEKFRTLSAGNTLNYHLVLRFNNSQFVASATSAIGQVNFYVAEGI